MKAKLLRLNEETFPNTVKDASEKMVSNIINSYKPEKCELCGNVSSEFINSHCLPKFILKYISGKNGQIKFGQDLSGANLKNRKHSISNSWTFKNICSKCDNDFFKDYENEGFFQNKITDMVLNEIAAKNCLRYIYKRSADTLVWQKNLSIARSKNIKILIDSAINEIQLAKMDINDYRSELKTIIKNKNEHLYYLIDEINLPYRTTMAFQGPIAIKQGFDANTIINDSHNYDPNYQIQHLNICVFPHKQGTKIILFCRDGANRLRKFYKQYRKLSIDKKLYCINYLILLESEEWFVKYDFNDELINQETKNLISTVDKLIIETTFNEDFKNNKGEYVKRARQLVQDRWIIKTEGNIFNFLQHHS